MKIQDFDNWDNGYFDGLMTALQAVDEVLESLPGKDRPILQQGLFVAVNEIQGLLDDVAKTKAKNDL
jgi:hypothetical protein